MPRFGWPLMVAWRDGKQRCCKVLLLALHGQFDAGVGEDGAHLKVSAQRTHEVVQRAYAQACALFDAAYLALLDGHACGDIGLRCAARLAQLVQRHLLKGCGHALLNLGVLGWCELVFQVGKLDRHGVTPVLGLVRSLAQRAEVFGVDGFGLCDEGVVEARVSGLVATDQHEGYAARVEGEGDAEGATGVLHAEFLQVGVSRTFQGIGVGAAKCGAFVDKQPDGIPHAGLLLKFECSIPVAKLIGDFNLECHALIITLSAYSAKRIFDIYFPVFGGF